MNTKDLKCFQAVYEERSVSRAARRLFITPQGLSKNIRQLEEELHAVLFVRTSHGMAPTESGRFLYERSGRVIRQLEEIENGLRQLEQRRERIRIGCANGALNLLPLGVILAFGAAHPEFRLEWREPQRSGEEKAAGFGDRVRLHDRGLERGRHKGQKDHRLPYLPFGL